MLLESVAGGHEAVGVRASVLGAPLSMHIQTTERDGLTPGGAEILDPLPGAGVEQLMPGVNVLGTEPELVLTNPQGSDTTASVAVSGADGPIAAAGLEDVEVPAGTVVRVPLTGLKDGSYTVSVTAADPVLAVTRSSALGAELSGDTLGTPVDFTLVSSAPALGTSGVLALPAEGAAGGLTLTAETAGSVSIVPLAADGSAGTPVEVDLAADASVWVSSRALAVDGAPASGLTVVPEVPGAVRASWMQRESDGADGVLLSSLPVLSAQQSGETLTVRVQDCTLPVRSVRRDRQHPTGTIHRACGPRPYSLQAPGSTSSGSMCSREPICSESTWRTRVSSSRSSAQRVWIGRRYTITRAGCSRLGGSARPSSTVASSHGAGSVGGTSSTSTWRWARRRGKRSARAAPESATRSSNCSRRVRYPGRCGGIRSQRRPRPRRSRRRGPWRGPGDPGRRGSTSMRSQ